MTNDTMSIEEYRNYLFTEKEEWNTVYNPKRCSIDALIKIEIKQRGNGPDKKVYTESTTEPGPYFDPKSLHLHIWKNSKLIKNVKELNILNLIVDLRENEKYSYNKISKHLNDRNIKSKEGGKWYGYSVSCVLKNGMKEMYLNKN